MNLNCEPFLPHTSLAIYGSFLFFFFFFNYFYDLLTVYTAGGPERTLFLLSMMTLYVWRNLAGWRELDDGWLRENGVVDGGMLGWIGSALGVWRNG